jgi:HEPN domain-containing protein
VTSEGVARDYLRRAQTRRLALDTFLAAELHGDVMRETQEIVELVLKGALRFVGVEPPKRHDVHDIVERFLGRLPAEWAQVVGELRAMLTALPRSAVEPSTATRSPARRRRSCTGRTTPGRPWPSPTVCSRCTGGCSVEEREASDEQRDCQ